MPASKKKAKKVDRTDKWYLLAKEQGYRSRAAYKIAQINKEYCLMSGSTKVVLDLCAAPGGWSQIAAQCVAPDAAIIAVDLLPIRPIPRVRCIVGDITTQQTRDVVKREVKNAGHARSGVDVVLCDGAPNVGAAYAKDAFVQNEISLLALRCGIDCGLRRGGSFCTKVYRSQDYNALLWAFGRLFEKVKAHKPAASRQQSAEIFVVCEGYLKPDRLDAKFTDPKFVFADVAAAKGEGEAALVYAEKPLSVMHPQWGKKVRHRTGYDDRNEKGLLRLDAMTATDLVKATDAPQLLAERSKIVFDAYLDHPATTAEVLACAEDLHVLSRGDFRSLLKWREKVLKSEQQKTASASAAAAAEHQQQRQPDSEEEDEAEDAMSVDSEEDMAAVLERAQSSAALEHRKAKKRAARLAAKKRARRGVGIVADTGVIIGGDDEEIFSFATAARAGGVDAIANAALPEEEDEEDGEAPRHSREMTKARAAREAEMTYATDRDRAAAIEAQLDEAYDEYAARRLNKRNAPREEKQKVSKKKRTAVASGIIQEDAALLDGDVDAYVRELAEPESSDDDGFHNDDDDDDDDDDSIGESDREEAPAVMTAAASRWFSRPIFDDVADEELEAKEAAMMMMPKTEKELRKEKRKKAIDRQERKAKRQRSRLGEDDGVQIVDGAPTQPQAALVAGRAPPRSLEEKEAIRAGLGVSAAAAAAEASKGGDDGGFEVVAAAEEDGEPLATMRTYASDSDSEHDDVDTKAQSLALASMMLRRSKAKELIDASYNRFAWNDPRDLPTWFLDDEKRHYRPQLPIRPDLVAEMKAKFTELSNKPIKKVAEARARKSHLAKKRLDAAKRKADALANDPELSSRQKLKAVQQTMAKGKKALDTKEKVYVVARKNGSSKTVRNREATKNSRTVKVDARLKADKRAVKAKAKRGPKKRK